MTQFKDVNRGEPFWHQGTRYVKNEFIGDWPPHEEVTLQQQFNSKTDLQVIYKAIEVLVDPDPQEFTPLDEDTIWGALARITEAVGHDPKEF